MTELFRGFQITVTNLVDRCHKCRKEHERYLAILDGTDHRGSGDTVEAAIIDLLVSKVGDPGEVLTDILALLTQKTGWSLAARGGDEDDLTGFLIGPEAVVDSALSAIQAFGDEDEHGYWGVEI